MNDVNKHNYMKKIMKMVADGELAPNEVTEVDVQCEDSCAKYSNGYCDCNPIITKR